MKRVCLHDLPWLQFNSPSGRFAGAGQQVSEALGAVVNANLAQGGHPFDLEVGRLPPHQSGCPLHSHSAQWELFLIREGTGRVRYGPHERLVQAGDVVLHPPGEPHQLINVGDTELHYFLIADNPLTEFSLYPDSNKLGVRPGGATFLRTEVDYWLGEDEGAPAPPPDPNPPAPPAEPLARFVSIDSIPWETRRSPSGRFSSECRDLSIALGGPRHLAPAHGGHPFDVQLRRVTAGAAICPFHLHQAQWELFVFLAGCGEVRSGTGRHSVSAGDVVLHPPGLPHQTIAGPDGPLECLIIADNPLVDVFYYPDSDKWGMRPPGTFFRLTEVPYFDGEE